MNDTRTKLEQLFRRLSDPAVSDLDALADFVWFRKLRLDPGDVSQALGAPAAPTSTDAGTVSTDATDGPVMPFGKHRGVALAALAKREPDYLRWLLGPDMKKPLAEPLRGQVRAALGLPVATPPAPKPVSQDFENS